MRSGSSAAGGAAATAATAHVAAVQLGIKLLVASFEADTSMREALLRELQGRLVGVKEEVALPFVAVLGLLVQRHPRAVLEHASLLKVSVSNKHCNSDAVTGDLCQLTNASGPREVWKRWILLKVSISSTNAVVIQRQTLC